MAKAKKKSAKAKDAAKTWHKLRKAGDKSWYAAYRRSLHWRRLRKKVLEACHYQCQACGHVDPHQDNKRGTRLEVHHLSYERLGNEPLTHLQALCGDCHAHAHRRGKGFFWNCFLREQSISPMCHSGKPSFDGRGTCARKYVSEVM